MGYIAKGSITLDTVNDAYTVSLSKQSCVIHADFDGSNPQLSEAQTTVTVLRGDKVMAFDCAPVVDDGSNINFTIENTNRTSYRIVLTSIPTNSLEGTLQFRITTDDGYATTIQFSYTVVRESTMLDWIQDWEGGKTKIGGTYIMTPKIFIGKKDEYAEYGEGGTNAKDSIMSVPGLTGVYIGPDTESTGVYGYLNSEEIFHLNGTGGMIGGWVIDSYGIRSKNGNLQILSGRESGEIRAINDEGDSIWRITENGAASFAKGNVRFFANGDAVFKGRITSEEGEIGGWTIEKGRLYNTSIGISASDKYIAIANVESIPTGSEWKKNHFDWMCDYGGVALYYTSRNDFGFIAYGPGGDNMVFHAGSTNYIAGWNFDNEAIWSGTKNNTTSEYSTDGITIGTNGLRGIKWYIDSSGDVSFMGGKIRFSAANNGGEIVGWQLNDRRLSTDKVALTSDDKSVGLYMSAATDAQFNTLDSLSLEGFIAEHGGMYMKVKTDSADFAAYNSEGTRLFEIKSKDVSHIAGWQFDAETLYTGKAAVTSGYTSSGQITLGPTGLRGYKWRFENDGSGAVAGGNISWDSNGNVTFAESVKLAWGQCVDADGNSISNYLTKIDAHGIYTGTLRADQIIAGTIDATKISADVILSNGEAWALNKDGSGYLANNNISWDKDGNTSFNGEIVATSGSIAGFNISAEHIGMASSSADQSSDGLSIYSNFFRVGGSKGYVKFGNDLEPPSLGGVVTTVGRIVNRAPYTQINGVAQTNCGLQIDVVGDSQNQGVSINITGGTKNYGVSSNAPIMATSFISTKAKLLTFSGGSYNLDFSQSNVILMYYKESGQVGTSVTLPTESSVAQSFGYETLPNDFATVVILRVREGSLPITIRNIYSYQETPTDYTMTSGNSVMLLVSKCDGFRYQFLNRSI